LAEFTHAVVRNLGAVDGKPLDDFIAAGYSSRQVLELLLGVTMKTLGNYANHVMHTPLDDAFKGEAWSK